MCRTKSHRTSCVHALHRLVGRSSSHDFIMKLVLWPSGTIEHASTRPLPTFGRIHGVWNESRCLIEMRLSVRHFVMIHRWSRESGIEPSFDANFDSCGY